jgi:uncharacterized protein YjbK
MKTYKKIILAVVLVTSLIVGIIIYNGFVKDLCNPKLIEEFKITEIIELETMQKTKAYELTLNLPSPCHSATVGQIIEYDEEGNIDYEKTLEDNKISILIFDPYPRCGMQKTQVTYLGTFTEEQAELETKIYCMHRGDSELIYTKKP